jgi:hypothetical protein
MDAAGVRRADHQRAGQAPACAVAIAGGVVHHLVDAGIEEAAELDFRDRLQALRAETDRHRRDQGFGQRGVDHAVFAELVEQAERGAEHAAVAADVFAEDDDVVVARHLGFEREVDGFNKSDIGHEFLKSCVRSPRQAGRGLKPQRP